MRAVLGLCALLTLVGCDPRQPVTRGQAAAIAGNLQLREGWAWGDPTDIQTPVTHGGRLWWQVAYRGGQVILVDAESGWARLPPDDYARRRAAVAEPTTTPPAAVVAEGRFLLVLVPAAEGDSAPQEREAARLNHLASQTGLYPLFGVHTDRLGRHALVYGWQGDRGIAQDDRVVEWVRLRTDHDHPAWVDLLR